MKNKNTITPIDNVNARPSCQSSCESKTMTPSINLTKNTTMAANIAAEQRQKIMAHPCYSNDAHHKYARMHLPVAPACNIQCNYCNRKYDCSNESRPGVVSELLTPQQALLKAQAVAKAIPQLSVIGIAGPGDPLANPTRTFETLSLIRQAMPDIKLCISTNGLTLVDHIDKLVALGVDHVTITINTVDEEIAAQIYKWVYFGKTRYHGQEAGRVLIQRQMQGIAALAKTNILTKVNSVLIPGVNDQHLPVLSETLRQHNVFLHNIMPLISQPEHGTVFGLSGQRQPTQEELEQVRELAGGNVAQMQHCQQCRADAVGMLEEDKSADFPLHSIPVEPEDYRHTMSKRCRFQSAVISQGRSESEASLVVAVATKHNQQIDLHFGHADCFNLYLITRSGHHYIGERRLTRYCTGDNHQQSESVNDSNLAATVRALHGVDIVLCCRIGTPPQVALNNANIRADVEHAYQGIDETLLVIFAQYSLLAESKWIARQQLQRREVV